jgi:hypothetical protein
MATKKVLVTDYEIAVLIQALKIWRAGLVAQIEIGCVEKARKDLLSEIRVDVEALADKLQNTRQRGAV